MPPKSVCTFGEEVEADFDNVAQAELSLCVALMLGLREEGRAGNVQISFKTAPNGGRSLPESTVGVECLRAKWF